MRSNRPRDVRALVGTILLTGLVAMGGCDSGPPPIASITVAPGAVSMTFLSETVNLTATLTDEEGANRRDVTPEWTSSNPSVVTISPDGVANAIRNGTAVLQASAGGVTSNPVTATVSQEASSVEVTGGDLEFTFLGETAQLGAVVADQGGSPVDGATVSWSSTNEGVATVAGDGTVTAVAEGGTNIRASVDGASGSANVVVDQIASVIEIETSEVTLASLGETFQVSPTVRDAGGSPLSVVELDWVSGNPAVATVSGLGVITAVSNGTTTVTATGGNASAQLNVTIDQEVAEVTVSPEILVIDDVGLTGQLTASVTDAGGSDVEGAAVIWVSDDPGIATVEGSGGTVTVTGQSLGTTRVTATSSGQSGAADVGVGEVPVPTLLLDQRVTGLSAELGEQLFFKVTVPAGVGELIVGIGNGNGNQDADLFVRHGELPTLEEFDCVDGNQFADELCEISNPTAGDWFILIDAFSAFSDLDLLAMTRQGTPGLHIDFNYGSGVTAEIQDLLEEAGARWGSALPTELFGIWGVADGACGVSGFDVDGPIEDIVVHVVVLPIDGPGGLLASAGPCVPPRPPGFPNERLPIAGVIQIDQADSSGDDVPATLLHELGHVLGFGTLWGIEDFPVLIDGAGTSDPIFTGPLAREAFDEVGGTSFNGAKVPLENTGGAGTRDGHWRESVFDSELMTGFSEGTGTEALSIVTLQAMADIGWTADLSQADSYVLPGSGSGAAAVASQGRQLRDRVVVRPLTFGWHRSKWTKPAGRVQRPSTLGQGNLEGDGPPAGELK